MSKTLKRLTGTSDTKSSGAKASENVTIKFDALFGSFDLFKSVTSSAVHDALKQAAEDVMYDAKMREPYVTMHECDRYIDSIHGIRVPEKTISMRKNKDGVWEAKRAKKTD